MFANHYRSMVVLFVYMIIMLGYSSAKPEKRLTCELWSFIGAAACAAHCIELGHNGGSCDSHNYCICNKGHVYGSEPFGKRADEIWQYMDSKVL